MTGASVVADSTSACVPRETKGGGLIPRSACSSSAVCSGVTRVIVRTTARSGMLSTSQLGEASPKSLSSVSLLSPPDDKEEAQTSEAE